jgi:CRP-like cAMP-binding protein
MQRQPCRCHSSAARAYTAEAAALPPTRNRLLAALPEAVYRRLLPHLEPVELPLGCSVHAPGERAEHLFFPTAGIVSLLYLMRDGATAEIALTGNEGVLGTSLYLGGESTLDLDTVVCAGYAYRLPKRVLAHEVEQGGSLQILLLHYAQVLITQIAQTAVCNRHHTVEQQLCRWLLQRLDRLPCSQMHVTQEAISGMLGVRREGVTEAAASLRHAGAIEYRRGNITVVDRPMLEQRVCECYGVVQRETARLLSWKPKADPDYAGKATPEDFTRSWASASF